MRSIRRRLLAWLLGGVAAAVAAGAVSTYRVARDEANTLFDYQLQQTALSLSDHALGSGLIAPLGEPDASLEVLVQIWNRDGVRLYLSHPRSGMPDRAQMGFVDVATREGQWRVFSAQLGGHVVQVAQPQAVRDRLAASVALRTVWPLIAMLPVLGLLIWITVGRGLAPLERLAREVRGRSPIALAPLAEGSLPQEIQPLAHSLNDLLARLGQALDAQRTFVADAAHELRTPLTALRLQARLAERARDEAERGEAIAKLKEGIERAGHLVQQLLALARAEGAAAKSATEAVALDELAREVVGEHAAIAQAKGIDLGMGRAVPVRAIGERAGLRTLLANLVDNAVKYTPPGGRVDVSVDEEHGAAVLEVSDNGPGIPLADRERVFDRFYRRDGGATEGSGLGLSIVRSIVERHGGSIRLDEAGPSGGLKASVRLPARSASS